MPIRTARGDLLVAALPYFPRSRLITLEEARGKTIAEIIDLMRAKLMDQIDRLAGEVRDYRESHGEEIPAVLMAHYTVQGAVFGGVKAAVDRAGATGFSHLTGAWPGTGKD